MANAVLDGVDGILLGAETLRGKYAVQTVQTILAICHQAEKAFDHNYHFEHLMQACYHPPQLLCMVSSTQSLVFLLWCPCYSCAVRPCSESHVLIPGVLPCLHLLTLSHYCPSSR